METLAVSGAKRGGVSRAGAPVKRGRRIGVRYPNMWVEIDGDTTVAAFVAQLRGAALRVRWNHRIGAVEVYAPWYRRFIYFC